MSECCASCDAQEAKARADGRVAPDDVCVTMAELQEIWAMARESGQVCNGDTGRVLAERYGDRLYHVTGAGWFIRRPAVSMTYDEWQRRIPAYADGSPVAAGDKIRYRQAPGGLMARSGEWTYGTAVPHPHDGEMVLEADGRHYGLFGHEIERAL